jgi:hypothetical protein
MGRLMRAIYFREVLAATGGSAGKVLVGVWSALIAEKFWPSEQPASNQHDRAITWAIS